MGKKTPKKIRMFKNGNLGGVNIFLAGEKRGLCNLKLQPLTPPLSRKSNGPFLSINSNKRKFKESTEYCAVAVVEKQIELCAVAIIEKQTTAKKSYSYIFNCSLLQTGSDIVCLR